MVVSDNRIAILHPSDPSTVSTGKPPQAAAAREVPHEPEPGETVPHPAARAAGGDGTELLRTAGEDLVLPGKGGMLRAEPAEGELRLPLVTEAIWNDFHARLRGYVRRRIGAGPEVDDVVQKIFLDIHRGLPRLRRQGRVAAWVFRTAHNAIVDHYRSPARRREAPAGGTAELEAVLPIASLRDDAPLSEAPDAASCVLPAVARLRPADREAIETIDLRGTTQKDAAEQAGISLPAMKARIQRARRRLREALLECCEFALDARGGVMDCASRRKDCHGA
jgi:RNA polymerase sigma-70 factor (ECF subfamily)